MKIQNWLPLFFVLALVSSARARIGENQDQAAVRYGSIQKVTKGPHGFDSFWYQIKDIEVRINFLNGRAASITFSGGMSLGMLSEMMKANSDGQAWTIDAKGSAFESRPDEFGISSPVNIYRRADGMATARHFHCYDGSDILRIETVEFERECLKPATGF
jgi:hypothetical protein